MSPPARRLPRGASRPGRRNPSRDEGRDTARSPGPATSGCSRRVDLEHRGVDRGTGVERRGRKPATPPKRHHGAPDRARGDRAAGRSSTRARWRATCHWTTRSARTRPPAGSSSRRCRIAAVRPKGGFATHPVRRARERHLAHVGVHHDHVGRGREPPRQPLRQRRVDLDGEHRRRAFGERGREQTGSGAEVDDAVMATPHRHRRRAAPRCVRYRESADRVVVATANRR